VAFARDWQILDAGGWGRSYVGDLFDSGIWAEPLWEIARRTRRQTPAVEIPVETYEPPVEDWTWDVYTEGASVPEVAISEVESAIYPDNCAAPVPPGHPPIPAGASCVIIDGYARQIVEGIEGPPVVLEQFDPGAIIGEVPVASGEYDSPGNGQETGSVAGPASGDIRVTEEGNDDMAIDWGGLISGGIDLLQGQRIGGGPGPAAYQGPGSPNYTGFVTGGTARSYGDNGNGKKCRRRRRRLLTPTDLSDIAALVAIAGKGTGMNLAIAKAVRR